MDWGGKHDDDDNPAELPPWAKKFALAYLLVMGTAIVSGAWQFLHAALSR